MNDNVKIVSKILAYVYGIVPIVAGIDKFSNLLTDWSAYLPEGAIEMLPFSPAIFMGVVGVIEIATGALVFFKTRIGAYVVMFWLISIAIVLMLSGQNFDVAVRDLVMAAGAFSLAKLYD